MTGKYKNRLHVAIAVVLLIAASPIASYPDIKAPIGKVINTSWLEQATLKYGLLTTMCVSQALTGLTESHKFSGSHIVSDDDYHIYRTAQDVAAITTGWFIYANVRNDELKWWNKTLRITGALLISRNMREWAYKANRTGDPFNYSDKYTFNQKAIVYIKWDGDKGKFIDAYIPGTGKAGVIIDVACLWLGTILFK